MGTENKHTPGPWTVITGKHAYGNYILKEAAEKHREWLLNSGSEAFSHDEQEANARLIAAAPDLLAALKKIEWGRSPGKTSEWATSEQLRDIARAAIAKARGLA